MTREQSIAQAAQRVALAEETLHTKIRLAHEEGLPLRTIAKAANLSHETIRRITQEG